MGNFARTNAEFPTNAVRGFLVITVKLAVEHRAKGDKTRLRPELLELVQPTLYCAKFAIPQFQIFRPFSARCVPPFSDMAETRLELGNALRYALCCGRFRLRAEKRVLRLGFPAECSVNIYFLGLTQRMYDCYSTYDTTSRVGEVVVRGRTMERGHQAQEQRNDAQPPVDSFGV